MKTIILALVLFSVACGGPAFTASPDEAAGAPVAAGAGSPPSTDPSGGSSQAGTAAVAASGGDAGTGGQGGALSSALAGGAGGQAGQSVLVASGGQGGSVAMAQGGSAGATTPSPCQTGDQACHGSTCGYAVSDCGVRFGCGTPVCGTAPDRVTTQSCVADPAGVSSCQVTCHDAGVECGSVPAHGLECGQCANGGDCGVVRPGVCSTCQDNGAALPGTCSIGQHVWGFCQTAPKSGCVAAFEPTGERLTNQWCCS